jgi:hypothetical protein
MENKSVVMVEAVCVSAVWNRKYFDLRLPNLVEKTGRNMFPAEHVASYFETQANKGGSSP